MRNMILAFSVALLLPATGSADDASRGAPLPPLELTPGSPSLQPTGGLVFLGGNDTVEVLLDLPRGPASQLTLSWPAYGWLGESEPYPIRHAPELQVDIDGRPITIEEHVEAHAGNRAIGDLLRKAGINPWTITESPPFLTAPQRDSAAADAFAELQRAGAVSGDGDRYLAGWKAARQIRFAVPAGAATLSLRYTAMPAFAGQGGGQALPARMLKAACVAKDQISRAFRDGAWTAREYTIPMGISGRAPAMAQVKVGAARATSGWIGGCASPGRGIFGPIAEGHPVTLAVASDGALHLLLLTRPPLR